MQYSGKSCLVCVCSQFTSVYFLSIINEIIKAYTYLWLAQLNLSVPCMLVNKAEMMQWQRERRCDFFCLCVCFYFTVSVKESKRGRAAGDFISQRDGWVPSVWRPRQRPILNTLNTGPSSSLISPEGWQLALLSAPYIHACPGLSGLQVIYLFRR